MHVRYCECDACLPGTPAQVTRVTSTRRPRPEPREPRVRLDPKELKRGQNARAYMRRKLREAEA